MQNEQSRLVEFLPDFFYHPTYEWKAPVDFDLFYLVFPTFATLAAASATPQQQTVNVPNDSDFELRRIIYHMDNAAAAFNAGNRPLPNVTIQITDTGSGRNLQNNPVPLEAVACSGEMQRDLPWVKIFARNSQIQVTLTNFDAAATPNIRLTFVGRKIFTLSQKAA